MIYWGTTLLVLWGSINQSYGVDFWKPLGKSQALNLMYSKLNTLDHILEGMRRSQCFCFKSAFPLVKLMCVCVCVCVCVSVCTSYSKFLRCILRWTIVKRSLYHESPWRKKGQSPSYTFWGGRPALNFPFSCQTQQPKYKTRSHSLFKNSLTSLVGGIVYKYKDPKKQTLMKEVIEWGPTDTGWRTGLRVHALFLLCEQYLLLSPYGLYPA